LRLVVFISHAAGNRALEPHALDHCAPERKRSAAPHCSRRSPMWAEPAHHRAFPPRHETLPPPGSRAHAPSASRHTPKTSHGTSPQHSSIKSAQILASQSPGHTCHGRRFPPLRWSCTRVVTFTPTAAGTRFRHFDADGHADSGHAPSPSQVKASGIARSLRRQPDRGVLGTARHTFPITIPPTRMPLPQSRSPSSRPDSRLRLVVIRSPIPATVTSSQTFISFHHQRPAARNTDPDFPHLHAPLTRWSARVLWCFPI